MNAVNHLALTNGGMGQTPTAFQMSTYPECFQNRITLLPEGVDLNACRPAHEVRRSDFRLRDMVFRPEEKVVTFLSRTLEPYRGFHVFMRSLPRLMRERPDLRVVVVGGTECGYGPKLASGTWKDHFLNEVRGKLDGERLHFVGRLDGGDHLRLFQRSDAHVYLTYPFVLSWSLREALACGTPVVCNDVAPVRDFVRDGVNGLLSPGFDPDVLAGKVLGLLDGPWLDGQLRDGARVFAERHLAMEDYLRSYDALLARAAMGTRPSA
jgi:glycosyltransferase involved in cell wall biosynthesis